MRRPSPSRSPGVRRHDIGRRHGLARMDHRQPTRHDIAANIEGGDSGRLRLHAGRQTRRRWNRRRPQGRREEGGKAREGFASVGGDRGEDAWLRGRRLRRALKTKRRTIPAVMLFCEAICKATFSTALRPQSTKNLITSSVRVASTFLNACAHEVVPLSRPEICDVKALLISFVALSHSWTDFSAALAWALASWSEICCSSCASLAQIASFCC